MTRHSTLTYQLLIDSVPVPDPTDKWDVNISLPSEEEMRTAASKGCRYYPRCPHRMDRCLEEQPPLFMMEKEKHEAACYLYEENEVAPIEPPILVNRPITDAIAVPRRTRTALVAAVLVILAFAIGLVIGSNREPETIIEEVIVEVTAVPVEAKAQPATSEPGAAEPEVAAPAAEAEALPAFLLSADGAVDKGALALNVTLKDELPEPMTGTVTALKRLPVLSSRSKSGPVAVA